MNLPQKLGKTVVVSNNQLKLGFMFTAFDIFLGIGVKRKAIGRQGEPSNKKAKTDRYVQNFKSDSFMIILLIDCHEFVAVLVSC